MFNLKVANDTTTELKNVIASLENLLKKLTPQNVKYNIIKTLEDIKKTYAKFGKINVPGIKDVISSIKNNERAEEFLQPLLALENNVQQYESKLNATNINVQSQQQTPIIEKPKIVKYPEKKYSSSIISDKDNIKSIVVSFPECDNDKFKVIVQKLRNKAEEKGIEIRNDMITMDINNKTIAFHSKHKVKYKQTAHLALLLGRILQEKQTMNFIEGTKELNSNVEKLFGETLGNFKKMEEDLKTSKEIQNRINDNTIKNPQLSDNFQGLKHFPIEMQIEQLSTSNAPVNPEFPYGPNNYSGLFNLDLPTPEQKQAAKKASIEGVKFLITRKSSILADEPGFGKGSQAIVATHLTKNKNQKVLVISPTPIVSQNWIGDFAGGPQKFCGYSPNSIQLITDDNAEKILNDPNVHWIILQDSDLKRKNPKLLPILINSVKNKLFSSVIVDEIQRYKSNDSDSFKRIKQIIEGNDDIKYKIGLSGTPADNTPVDMFTQLDIIQHPLIAYNQKGKRSGKSITAESFANQFLGGEELSELISLSREMTSEDQRFAYIEEWAKKCYSTLTWATNLTPEDKINIAKLFSQTFLRRSTNLFRNVKVNYPKTEDGKPALLTHTQPPKITTEKDEKNPNKWHMANRENNANTKAISTAQFAINFLQNNPGKPVFIATYFVEVSKTIANIINTTIPNAAFAVNSENNSEERNKILSKFKTNKGTIKALVFTLGTGAVGFSFPNCNTAIINDTDFNPSVNLQAEYRINRADSQFDEINIYYNQFSDEIENTDAVNYDRRNMQRLNSKKAINEEISKIFVKLNDESLQGQEKITIINSFVENTIENIVIELDFPKMLEKFFYRNIESAIESQTIESIEMMYYELSKDKTILTMQKFPNDFTPQDFQIIENCEKEDVLHNPERRKIIAKLNVLENARIKAEAKAKKTEEDRKAKEKAEAERLTQNPTTNASSHNWYKLLKYVKKE